MENYDLTIHNNPCSYVNMDELTRWKELGELLVQRRQQLGWPQRESFARENGFRNSRVLYDIEKGRRADFAASTIVQFEQAYSLEPGAIERFIEGHDLSEMRSLEEVDRSAFMNYYEQYQNHQLIILQFDDELEHLETAEREEVETAARLAALTKAREIRYSRPQTQADYTPAAKHGGKTTREQLDQATDHPA